MEKKLEFSLVIIAKNEEKNLKRCILSVPLAKEVIVVDSQSTDRTVEIAASLGARVLQKEWQGFGAQKKWAASQASFDWILSLDADEEASPEFLAELQERFSSLDPQAVYAIPRVSFHLGRWIRHGGWFPDFQGRLFNRKSSQWNEDALHEKVVGARRLEFASPLRHYVFRDLSHNVVTNDRYSSLGAQDLHKRGKRFSVLKLVFKPWIKFIECYFFKLGFLDGLPGFIIAVGAAYSIFLRWAKLWELERLKNKTS